MGELVCWNCGTPLDGIPRPISRHASCPKCFNELHCCRLCRHYDPQISAGQCAEDRSDPPVVKDNANFCDWFQPAGGRYQSGARSKTEDARTRLDALFGGETDTQDTTEIVEPEPPTDQDRARAELDQLFASKSVKDDD